MGDKNIFNISEEELQKEREYHQKEYDKGQSHNDDFYSIDAQIELNKINSELLSTHITPIVIPEDFFAAYLLNEEEAMNEKQYVCDAIVIIEHNIKGRRKPFEYSVFKHTLFAVPVKNIWIKFFKDIGYKLNLKEYHNWYHIDLTNVKGSICLTNVKDFNDQEILYKLTCCSEDEVFVKQYDFHGYTYDLRDAFHDALLNGKDGKTKIMTDGDFDEIPF